MFFTIYNSLGGFLNFLSKKKKKNHQPLRAASSDVWAASGAYASSCFAPPLLHNTEALPAPERLNTDLIKSSSCLASLQGRISSCRCKKLKPSSPSFIRLPDATLC